MERELLVMMGRCKVVRVGGLSYWTRGWKREFSGFREKQIRLAEKRRKGRELMMTGSMKKITWIFPPEPLCFLCCSWFCSDLHPSSFSQLFSLFSLLFWLLPLVHVANNYIYRGKMQSFGMHIAWGCCPLIFAEGWEACPVVKSFLHCSGVETMQEHAKLILGGWKYDLVLKFIIVLIGSPISFKLLILYNYIPVIISRASLALRIFFILVPDF